MRRRLVFRALFRSFWLTGLTGSFGIGGNDILLVDSEFIGLTPANEKLLAPDAALDSGMPLLDVLPFEEPLFNPPTSLLPKRPPNPVMPTPTINSTAPTIVAIAMGFIYKGLTLCGTERTMETGFGGETTGIERRGGRVYFKDMPPRIRGTQYFLCSSHSVRCSRMQFLGCFVSQ